PATATAATHSVPPSIALTPDGPYTAQASQSDSAGNTATSSSTFVVDTTASVVTLNTITSPTNSNRPVFSGNAGTATGDSSTITVKIYSGGSASGTPVQVLTTTATAGSYSVHATSHHAPHLTYTAQASQSDSAGNTGASSAATFVVDTTAPAVTLNAVSGPSHNTQPTFSGSAGTATGDS